MVAEKKKRKKTKKRKSESQDIQDTYREFLFGPSYALEEEPILPGEGSLTGGIGPSRPAPGMSFKNFLLQQMGMQDTGTESDASWQIHNPNNMGADSLHPADPLHPYDRMYLEAFGKGQRRKDDARRRRQSILPLDPNAGVIDPNAYTFRRRR